MTYLEVLKIFLNSFMAKTPYYQNALTSALVKSGILTNQKGYFNLGNNVKVGMKILLPILKSEQIVK